MKTKLLLFCCLLLFAACNLPNREAQKLLRQAESIVETYPDSALRLIDSVMHMEVYFSEAERMEMSLLQGRAIYGDDRDATDPTEPNGNLMLDKIMNQIYLSPDLDRAPVYFAQNGHPEKAALAALYKGFDLQAIYADSAALHTFREAVHYGLQANDSLTTARALFQEGRTLYMYDKYEEAIAALDSSNQYFGHHLYERGLVQNMLGLNYQFMRMVGKAKECYDQCLAFAEKSGKNEAKWRALFNYGTMLGDKHIDQRDKGLEVLRQLEVEEVGIKKATKAYAMEKLFLNHNVRHHIKPVSDDSTSYYIQVWSEALSHNQYYKFSGGDMFCYYGRQHDLFPVFMSHWHTADNTYYGELYGLVKNYARQQQRNDYLALRNAMSEKKMQKQHTASVWSTWALVAILFIIIGAILFCQKPKALVEEPKTKPEAKTETINTKKEMQVFKCNSFVDQEITSRLRLILTALHAEKRANDPKKEWNPLVRQVMNGKETAFEAAVSVIESAYPGLQAKIRELYPDLNETDTKVCLLSCSDITNTEMGELLGLSVYSVNKSRSELRKKLGFEPGDLKNTL